MIIFISTLDSFNFGEILIRLRQRLDIFLYTKPLTMSQKHYRVALTVFLIIALKIKKIFRDHCPFDLKFSISKLIFVILKIIGDSSIDTE